MDDLNEKLHQHFKLVCLKCGSDDCVLNYDPGHTYSEYTVDPPSLSAGCNACKNNDVFLYD